MGTAYVGGDPGCLVDCCLEHSHRVGGAVLQNSKTAINMKGSGSCSFLVTSGVHMLHYLVKLDGNRRAAQRQGANDGEKQVAVRGAVDGDAAGAHRADVVTHNRSVRICEIIRK